jgi:putative membrane protein
MDSIFTMLLLGFIALQHVSFLILEMFLWQKPIGRKIFATTPEIARVSAKLAMNQGLYNGFLAAGLVWGMVGKRSDVAVFFCTCVVIAGIFGALTVNKRIFFVQGIPAIIALALLYFL